MTITNNNSANFVQAGEPIATNLTITTGGTSLSGWDYWTGNYYPNVITHSYPVYYQERAKDSGKQAFEIIKALQDKKLMTLKTVGDFIEAMDTLIKIL